MRPEASSPSLAGRLAVSPAVVAAVPRGRDDAVEGLRGFAASVVFGAHLLAPVPRIDPAYAPSPVWWQFEFAGGAVLIFFVLSGYVIGLTNAGAFGPPQVRPYLGRRFLRLLPINLLAVLLGWALVHPVPLSVLVGNLFFLQHSTPVGGWILPLLAGNPALWSLHYEMLYYLGFLLVWAQAPRLAGLGMLLLVLLLLPLAWPAGQFLSNYAAGGCFWLGGLWLAWRAPVAPADSRQPWLAMIVLCSLTWRLHPGAGIVRALGFADPTTPDVFLSQLDFLPIALWLSAAAAGRVLPGGRRWAVAAFVLPALSLGWQGLHWPDLARAERIYLPIYLALWLIALAATAWGQPRRLWHGLAGLGGISYAVYAFGMPLQFWMGKQAWLPSGRPASFLLRAALTIALTVAAAWWAERWWQPRWRRVLSR